MAIRPMEQGDLPKVAALIALVSESRPSIDLARFVDQTFFAQPWADPEIPSLVYVEDGEVLGTIAASVRKMRFDNRPVRMVCSGFLYAHPSVRHQGGGAQLLRALLSGPQELTITDTATDTVRRMWESLGGRTVHLCCLSFVRIFRPWRLGADRLVGKRLHTRSTSMLGPVLRPLDYVTTRAARSVFQPSVATGAVETLTPASMMEHLDEVTATVRLHTQYDEQYLRWLFGQLAGINNTKHNWCELVRKGGRAIGWHVCQLQPGGWYRVLQIAAVRREVQTVMEHLFSGAWKRGATAVVGRLESPLVAPLERQAGLVTYAQTGRMLIHARDDAITAAVLSGDALLTRLDGEWWAS